MSRRKRIWQLSTTLIFFVLGVLVCLVYPDPLMGIVGIGVVAFVAYFVIYKAGAV